MSSLIQQRMAVERARTGALVGLLVPSLIVAPSISPLLSRSPLGFEWFVSIGGVVLLALGLRRLRAGRRALPTFDRERGLDAGRQR